MQKTTELIDVKYRDKELTALSHETGDWVDVRLSAVTNMNVDSKSHILELQRTVNTTEPIHIAKGSGIKIWHGFCLKLPENTEAILCPRGSLYAKTGLIFTCSGVIDNGYCGNTDEWFSTFYATRDIVLHHNDRICQFRIQQKQPHLIFKPVSTMKDKDRGGHGSTGGYTQGGKNN
nr:MAG TPA: hypothetical protein [Caudoviricetes sp.]